MRRYSSEAGDAGRRAAERESHISTAPARAGGRKKASVTMAVVETSSWRAALELAANTPRARATTRAATPSQNTMRPNTATSYRPRAVVRRYPIPVLGVVRFAVRCPHGTSVTTVRPDGLALDPADVRDGLQLRHREVTACRCAVFEPGEPA